MEKNDVMIRDERKEQRKNLNMRLTQIDNELERVRVGYRKGALTAEQASEDRVSLDRERAELFARLNNENEAMDAAYLKAVAYFLETFQIVATRYKTAK